MKTETQKCQKGAKTHDKVIAWLTSNLLKQTTECSVLTVRGTDVGIIVHDSVSAAIVANCTHTVKSIQSNSDEGRPTYHMVFCDSCYAISLEDQMLIAETVREKHLRVLLMDNVQCASIGEAAVEEMAFYFQFLKDSSHEGLKKVARSINPYN